MQLALGAGGWAVAWQPPGASIQDLFGCPSFQAGQPGALVSRPERALGEVAAPGLMTTTPSFYDFRHPQAPGALPHWLYL